MNELLYTIATNSISDIDVKIKQHALTSLESGKVVFFPSFSFALKDDEQTLLSESILLPKEKNISYDYCKQSAVLINTKTKSLNLTPDLVQQFMHRYATFAKQLVDDVLPQYSHALRFGRTSFRPAEIKNRNISKHKDDTRLHVDSFPSSPVHGQRILRVFCNVNPYNTPRVWHVGEPFPTVLKTFAPDIRPYRLLGAKILNMVKVTKKLRSAYDHYMLKLHNSMKLDDQYQKNVPKHRVDFPSHSTWIVFTDSVSHAALSGQFLLEQTFYLPVEAMENQALSPLRQWEKIKSRSLV